MGRLLAGALHHLVPFAITRGIVNLVKHPGRATIAQNRLMIGLPLYGIWYALVWWLLASSHAGLAGVALDGFDAALRNCGLALCLARASHRTGVVA
ncbi:MAG: hypothetical protein V9H26_08975 [Verrucomicrobiota bacterium]